MNDADTEGPARRVADGAFASINGQGTDASS